MTKKTILAASAALLLAATAASADPVHYVWNGTGINAMGATKCPTYKMAIDVTVDGTAVKGLFQQEGRYQRHFETTLDAKGTFKTKAQLGGGGTMDVAGSISGNDGKIVLDGYCKFEGKLTKK